LMDKLYIDLYFRIYYLTPTNTFVWSCCNGHLDMSKWLFENFGDINIHAQYNEAFRWSCCHGHLDVSKWLCDITPDIRQNNDKLIKMALNRRNYELLSYICNLSPYYELEYTAGKVSGYKTNDYINIKH